MESWQKLVKIERDIYTIESHSLANICFDKSEELGFVVDLNGDGYLLEYINDDWYHKKIINIGHSTFISFNPLDESEIIIGSSTSEIQVIKHSNEFKRNIINDIYLFDGHTTTPCAIYFYQNNFLTYSKNEVIIWDLNTYNQIHQFKAMNIDDNSHNFKIKKCMISCCGLIVILYQNDYINITNMNDFQSSSIINLEKYGLKNIKDFVFTINGKSLILCESDRNIITFDIETSMIINHYHISIEDVRTIKNILIIPTKINPDNNNIICIFFKNNDVEFLNVYQHTYYQNAQLKNIKRLITSNHGKWIGYITIDGCLFIRSTEKLLKLKLKIIEIKLKHDDDVNVKKVRFNQQNHLYHSENHYHYHEQIEKDIKKILNINKLVPILKHYGEYPERYRNNIWRRIMKLPDNRKSYLSLNNKLINIKHKRKFNLIDKNNEKLLNTMIDKLNELCPLFKYSLFIPELIYPFVVVFNKEPIYAFETVLFIIINYCQKWFEYHPLPPFNILALIENILMEIDSELLQFYYDYNVTSSHYAWPLLTTTMSQVLTADQWLILWDHLLTHKRPSLLILSVIAYNISSKKIIISFLKEKQDFHYFFKQQGQIQAIQIIKTALQIDAKLSKKNHPSTYLREDFIFLPPESSYPPLLIGEYPKFILDKQKEIINLEKIRQDKFIKQKKKELQTSLAEKKRLEEETNAFIKKIQLQRFQELEHCYNEELNILKIGIDNESDSELSTSSPLSLSSPSTPSIRTVNNLVGSKSCEKLQSDVQKLELEVKKLLSSLKV